MITITFQDEPMHLFPERALYRERTRTLYIADVHLGKASAFAHKGVPIPASAVDGTTRADLDRLASLIVRTNAARLVILGDFLHARAGRDERTLDLLRRWRDSIPQISITLVRGNHDAHAGDPPEFLNFYCIDEGTLDNGTILLHHPCTAINALGCSSFAGHLHPQVSIPGIGPTPCFWRQNAQLIFPAFGSFTGGSVINPAPGDRVYALGEGHVLEIPPVMTAKRRTSRAR